MPEVYHRGMATAGAGEAIQIQSTGHLSYIPEWLNRSMGLLDDDKPIERIAAGDYRSVAQLISGLEDPGAV